MILHDAKLPPRKGYTEDQNINTGERYYRKLRSPAGFCKRKVFITSSQEIKIPKAKDHKFNITLVCGGELKQSDLDGLNSSTICKDVILDTYTKVQVTIGAPGEPTSFGEHIAAYERSESAKGLTIDGITYGLGETADHPATQGICIIEYEEPIYE